MPWTEMDDFVRVLQAAFVDGIGSVLLHGGRASNEATHAQAVKDQLEPLLGNQNEVQDVRYYKAIDTATGEIIGVAKWNIFFEQTEEQVEGLLHQPKPSEKGYDSVIKPILDYFYGNRRKFMHPRPFVCLNAIGTHPEHQGRGAGKRLVQWGVQLADQLGLPMYLEASKEGWPLYQKFGFEVLVEQHFEMEQFKRSDLSGVDINRVMIRPRRVPVQDCDRPVENDH